MAKTSKRLKVVKVRMKSDLGQAEPLGGNRYLIRIHPKHRSERSLMNTLVHESLHCGDFEMSERKVRHLTAVVVEALWGQGYRRVNN
jgi:hypothetical protein